MTQESHTEATKIVPKHLRRGVLKIRLLRLRVALCETLDILDTMIEDDV